MIQFKGDRQIARPVPWLFAKLTDATFLVGSLPDAKVGEATADRAAFQLKPKLSFLTGGLDATLEVTARETDRSASLKIVSKAIGASSTVVATLQFQEADSGTAIHWTGDLVEVTGLLKMVPKGLLQGTAEKVIEDTWLALESKLSSLPST